MGKAQFRFLCAIHNTPPFLKVAERAAPLGRFWEAIDGALCNFVKRRTNPSIKTKIAARGMTHRGFGRR